MHFIFSAKKCPSGLRNLGLETASLVTLCTFLSDSNFKFAKPLSQASNEQNKHKTTKFNIIVAYLFHFNLFKKP